jgi:DnaJ family protein C protein 7
MYDLENALKINPKSTKNLKRLANINIILGKLGEAEMEIQRCINFEPKDSTHVTDMNILKSKMKDIEQIHELKSKQEWARCEELCAKILKDCTEHTAIKLIYVESLLNQVKLTEALNFLVSKLNDDEKTNDEFNYYICLTLYYDGKYEKAKKLVQDMMKRMTDHNKFESLYKILSVIETEKEKANEVFKNGKYEEAIELYTKLLELDPDNRNFNATIVANRALCYQKLNKEMDALKDINRAICLNERYWKAYQRRGNIYLSLKMYEEAKWDFQKVKENDISNKDINKLLEEAKKHEKAAKKRDYYKILELDKNANENDIRKAYKKLALKWHPDRNSESEESKKFAEKMFRDINDAYSVLSDAKKKQQYDSGMDPLNPEEANGKKLYLIYRYGRLQLRRGRSRHRSQRYFQNVLWWRRRRC